MDTRRSFLKKAGILSGATGMAQVLPPTLQKALAIDPAPGSTFYDAEHVVFLMQENRSFDHAFGTLQGVRGYNDPRAIRLPNNNSVFLQTNAKGETYAPFHLDIQHSKITWMGCLPHSWTDQVDARNEGKMDKWLHTKDPGGDFKGMPLTMGYYNRADLPFYYSLADAFTICDQHFCSSLTGTTPNRLYFWSGTIHDRLEAAAQANVWNENADHGSREVAWKTYPERLEDYGISWKVYQNEIYADVGLGKGHGWLSNFGDNPLEYMRQYNLRLSPEYLAYLPKRIEKLVTDIADLEKKLANTPDPEPDKAKYKKTLEARKKSLTALQEEQRYFTKEKYESLTAYEKNIHNKAFTNNRNDPHYHELDSMNYKDSGTERTIDIPKGDIFHQFRNDVEGGTLPTVSWLVAPQYFSDHPDSPWFGAWYISEAMDILTKNPEVWKKTIFILTYDENDGYYDHVPPFGAPNPYKQNTGKVSPGIDTTLEFVQKGEQSSQNYNRESNIGLGFRVPMVVASPWTRGGYVCSEVFDHTSSLQFLEAFLERKTGKKITEENITEWRRTVCGNLTSVFRPYNGEPIKKPDFVEKEGFIKAINNAKYKEIPGNYKKLSEEDIAAMNSGLHSLLPVQEKGVRPGCALPYELYVNAGFLPGKKAFEISFEAGNKIFGAKAAGSPFYVYAQNVGANQPTNIRNYAIAAGGVEKDQWLLNNFENKHYYLTAYGPNGFYRVFKGNSADPLLTVHCGYEKSRMNPKKLTGNLLLIISNNEAKPANVLLHDNSYKTGSLKKTIAPNSKISVVIPLAKSFGWYDISLTVNGYEQYLQQFAGHVETGAVSKTDPLMGGVL